MSTNKNATIRYQALNNCFRNPGKKYYIEDLIDACNEALLDIDPSSSGVKRRQIYEDIKFMQDSRGFDAPIESFTDGRRAFYRYSDLKFSINNQPLNEQEAQQLKESLLTLSRFRGMPQFDWVEEIKARLEQTFNLKSGDNILSFEENPYLTGREYIGSLFNAIVNQKVLKIKYKPYKAEKELIFTIHPYHLKQYNNRWFLFGLNDDYRNLTNMALDRILEISEIATRYIANTEIDFSEYFDDVIGVSVDETQEPQKIILKADENLLPYINSKPIHGSQKVKKDGEETQIELKLQLNYELESTIFSFGEKIEVLEPEALRTAIAKRIKVLNQKYLTCE